MISRFEMDQFIQEIYANAIGADPESQIKYLQSEIEDCKQLIDLCQKSGEESEVLDCQAEIIKLNNMIVGIREGKMTFSLDCSNFETNF